MGAGASAGGGGGSGGDAWHNVGEDVVGGEVLSQAPA